MYRIDSNRDALILASETSRLRIGFVTESIARVTMTCRQPFLDRDSLSVVERAWHRGYRLDEDADSVRVSTPSLQIAIDRRTGAIRYYAGDGRLLTREPERGGRWLTPAEIYVSRFNDGAEADSAESIDGIRLSVVESERVLDRHAFQAKLEFVFAEDEALFGFGSHEEGYGNLRGKSRELYQHNLKAVIPYFVSTRGYGVLVDAYSLMTFHDDALGSYIWADAVDELDYYFIAGDRFDDITRGYHKLTGAAPLPPRWFFGYAQCKERYVNAQELIDTVREFRRRGIPLDLIVLDWKSWPDGGGWGQKSLDPARFPDPQGLTAALHALNVKMMASIWPSMTGEGENRKEMLERGFMLGNRSTYNSFDGEARRCYWEQARRGLFEQGVDAWWCDCSEPFESDWRGAVKLEPHERLRVNVEEAKRYLDPGYIGAYSLLHSRGIYEGQRGVTDAQRVVNLTRSVYAGQHRYATTTWSGDICATWETLRRSIPEGLNFCAAGEPYWTVDIGGFFIKNDPALWFWRGDYDAGCRGLTSATAQEPDPNDTGCTDLGYWELYTRWLQYAAFLPMFRSHGTDAPREPWRFGEAGSMFYDAIVEHIRLRYRLLPYIYSVAAQVTLSSWSIMRPVAIDFPGDRLTHDLTDQYMFGPAMMVCPVTVPMYYERDSRSIDGAAKSRPVYLPTGAEWYDFRTEAWFAGGTRVETAAPIDVIPVFVRAGSIVPLGPAGQHVQDGRDGPIEIRVYRGADGAFPLYEDEGDNYNYEQGRRSVVMLSWSEERAELIVAARDGSFDGMLTHRQFQIVFISRTGRDTRGLLYTGEEMRVRPGAGSS